MVDEFLRLLASNLPSGTEDDCLKWKLTKNMDFTIRLFYHKLHGSSSVVFSSSVLLLIIVIPEN